MGDGRESRRLTPEEAKTQELESHRCDAERLAQNPVVDESAVDVSGGLRNALQVQTQGAVGCRARQDRTGPPL